MSDGEGSGPARPTQLGRYLDLELLGEGGMGAVYRGRDPSLDRVVAIKVVTNNRADFVARFRREARAIARLSHPHVVQVFDFGEDGAGNPYFVMELLPGRSLDKVLAERGPLPAELVSDLIRQAAEGLSAAHAMEIVHRDIKPANLVVDPQYQLKLVDFGIAHVEEGGDALTRPQSLMGTPHYMAPEMLRGEKVDGRADIYALGLTAFHLLAGRPPYEAPSSIALTVKQLSEPLPSLAKLAPATPAALVRLVERMSEKDRDQRIGSCQQIVAELDAMAAGSAPPARSGPRRAPMGLVVAAAAVVLGGIGAGVALRGRASDAGGGAGSGTGQGQVPGVAGVTPLTPKPDPVTAPVPVKPEVGGPLRVAVLKFKNLGGDRELDGLVEGIGETVINALAGTPNLTLVERNQVDQAIAEIDFGLTKYVDKQTAAALGAMTGVSVAVQGGFQLWQGQLRVSARMVRVTTGEIIDSLTVTRPKGDAFGIQDAVAVEIRKKLALMAAADK